MLKVVVITTLLSLCLGATFDAEWTAFKSLYSKQYEDGLDDVRKEVFSQNLNYINRHNAEADNGQHTYWLGINEYSDMTHNEFVRVMLGYRHDPNRISNELYVPQISEVPKEVDWRKKGYVTPVKNQGQCGSCWAFSTTGSLEGQHFKSTNKLVSLSEQNLIDCSKKEGNLGCFGGLMDNGFKYIKKNGGIDTEASYPYLAKNEKQCRFKKKDVGATLKSYKDIAKGDEKQLEKAVAEIGPISVAIDAGHPSFQHYKKGVYNEPKCSPKRLDHGVLAVGYGVDREERGVREGDKYWLVKNSWGKSWGMEGYIMMTKDKDNQCGIATSASYPIV